MLLTNSKVRRERGFDRRLQWCESMMGALNAAGAAVSTASSGADPRGREECWSETIRLYEKLIPLCGQKELYAPAEAIEEINKFMGSLSKLIEEHLKGHLAGGETTAPQECLQAIRSAAGKLAGIGRGHLGLEKLPPALTDSKQRFLGSFRGRTLGSHQDALS